MTAALVIPRNFHRLAIAASADEGLGQWLREMLGARQMPSLGRDEDPTSGESRDVVNNILEESGASTEILWLGRSPVVLLVPSDETGMLGRYVDRYGTGLHSVAWSIEDLWTADAKLRRHGSRITGVDIEGRHFFLHPSDTAGLLLELTDTELPNDPRDTGLALPPSIGLVDVTRIAWLTVVVDDAETAAEKLAEIVSCHAVNGLPRSDDGDTIVDVAASDIVLRYITPGTPESRYADAVGLRRGSLHSMCLAVPDLPAALEQLTAGGVGITAQASGLAWTDPKTTGNLEIEWVSEHALAPLSGLTPSEH
jgi:hypothetical protein